MGDAIAIGDNSGIGKRAYIRNIGGGKLTIGKNVMMAPDVIILTKSNSHEHIDIPTCKQFHIHRKVMMAPDKIMLIKSHFHERIDTPMYEQGSYSSKVVIEDDLLIGIRSIIIPGVKVGKRSIFGAGAVVTKDVSQYTIVGGVPARIIKKRMPEQ